MVSTKRARVLFDTVKKKPDLKDPDRVVLSDVDPELVVLAATISGLPNLLLSIERDDFSNKINRKILFLIETFYSKYRALPKVDELILLVETSNKSNPVVDSDEIIKSLHTMRTVCDQDFNKGLLWDIASDHVSGARVDKALVQIATDKKNIATGLSLLTDAARFELGKQDQSSFSNFGRLRDVSTIITKVPTYYKTFDEEILKGGVLNPSLTVYGGKPFAGKTLMLTNLCVNAIINGKRALYFSMELPSRQIMMRIDCALSGVVYHDLYKPENLELTKRNLEKMYSGGMGECHVFKYPPGTSVAKIATHCDLARSIYGPYDIVCVDYLGLLTPSKKVDTLYEKGKIVCEELVDLTERLNVPIHAATQLTKGSTTVSITDLNEGHLAESWGIQQVAYNVALLAKPSSNLFSHKIMAKWVKNRSGGSLGISTLYEVKDTFKIVESLDSFFQASEKAGNGFNRAAFEQMLAEQSERKNSESRTKS